MESTRSLVLLLLLLFPLCFSPAQSPESRLLTGEIQGIEKKLEDSALSGGERREALKQLARLRALSGDQETAAEFWIEAAFAEPGYRDDASLLEGARCLITLGEFEKAGANITAILRTGQDRDIKNQARFLGAHIEAFRDGNTEALSALQADPEYLESAPAILYTLWRASGDESYRTRLKTDYPASPEARIAGETGNISGPAGAMWLLTGGREEVRVEETVPALPPSGSTGFTTGSPLPESSARDRPVILQTGLFSREENAKAMAERLKAAGFVPAVTRRTMGDMVYWAVQIDPGQDLNAAIMGLKNAGFESFPVY
ncbi:MAG: SPOR domain-containing protein [Spirochaetaceae bacterium]|jgi:hypothetical protein|nr:SPOR domain-containing protein [Spirochaetaceae bacterium]